jgi:hypothetical protein
VIISTKDQASHNVSDAVQKILVEFGFDAARRQQDDPRPNSMMFIEVKSRPKGPQGEAKLRHQRM